MLIPFGGFRRGKTLATAQTLRWPQEAIEHNDKIERSRIYANFRESDQGRGRVCVAEVRLGIEHYEEIADLLASAPAIAAELAAVRKQHAELLEAANRAYRELQADKPREAWKTLSGVILDCGGEA